MQLTDLAFFEALRQCPDNNNRNHPDQKSPIQERVLSQRPKNTLGSDQSPYDAGTEKDVNAMACPGRSRGEERGLAYVWDGLELVPYHCQARNGRHDCAYHLKCKGGERERGRWREGEREMERGRG